MNPLDPKTVLVTGAISACLCLLVIFRLWREHRRSSPEMVFWLANYALQFLALLLIGSRGSIPDFVSVVPGTPLILSGALLLLIGLERYLGITRRHRYNYILLGVFALAHAWFFLVYPSLQARNIVVSLGVLAFTLQSAWLLLRRAPAALQPATRLAGLIFCGYVIASVFRIVADVMVPPGDDLFKSGLYDTLVILVYEVLLVALAFALLLMHNRRLLEELEDDIRQRKQTQESLWQSEERYRLANRATFDVIWDWNLQTNAVWWNDNLQRIFGYARNEIEPNVESWTLRIHPEDRGRVEARIRAAAQTGQSSWVDHYRFRRADSRYAEVEHRGYISRDGEGRPLRMLGALQDITERKRMEAETGAAQAETLRLLAEAERARRALLSLLEDHRRTEAALRESDEKFRNVFEFSPVGKSITGLDGSWRVNQSFCHLLGYSREELCAKKWQDITHPDDVEESLAIIKSLLAGEASRMHFEKRYLHKSGRIIWGEASTVLPRSKDGQPLYFLTVVNDITERKRAEEQVRAAHLETARLLNQAQQARQALLSVVEDQREVEESLRRNAAELKARNEELERWFRNTVNRELRMVELKKHVNELSRQLGQTPPFPLEFTSHQSSAVRPEHPVKTDNA